MSPVYYYGEGDAKERFQHWLDNPPSAIAVDVETISLKERHPLGFAVAFSPYESIYFQCHPEPPPELELIKKLLSDVRIIKIGHNWMFDMSVFPLIPIVGDSLDVYNIFDTNVAARLLGYQETSLPILSQTLFNDFSVVGAKDLLAKHGAKDMLGLDPMEVANHCQLDTKATYKLYLEWYEKIRSRFGEYFNVEMAVIPLLMRLSLRGLTIDQGARAELEESLTIEVEFYRRQLEKYGITNPGSSQQIGYMLAKRGSFLPFTKSKRQLTTREGELEFLDDPMAAAVLGYRHKSKFLSTYIIPIKGQDRFYTEYYLDTLVGRLNSKNRNIQNIPADARHMFLPDSGTFTTGDYSREHMFILAEMSQDRDLLRVLRDPDPKKNDIHQHTADRMLITRKIAKVVNYSMPYGGTARTISENGKIRDLRFCQRLLDGWFRTYKGAADWIQYAQREGVNTGWALPTLFGRRIRVPEEREERMKNKAVNYPILGSDGEIIKRALLLCARRGFGPPTMAITLHDSITFDGDIELPVEELEMIPGYRIPFEIKKTFTWE